MGKTGNNPYIGRKVRTSTKGSSRKRDSRKAIQKPQRPYYPIRGKVKSEWVLSYSYSLATILPKKAIF